MGAEEGVDADASRGDATVPPPPEAARTAVWKPLCSEPLMYYCDEFMSQEECDAIVRLALARAGRSFRATGNAKLRVDLTTTAPKDVETIPGDAGPRPADEAVLRSVERRIAGLCGAEPHGGEMPWAVHFTPSPAGPQEEAPLQVRAAPAEEEAAAPPPLRDSDARAKGLGGKGARNGSPPHQKEPRPARALGDARSTRVATRSSLVSAGSAMLGGSGQAAPQDAPSKATEPPDVERMSLGIHVDTNNCRERRWVTFIVYLRSVPAHLGGHTVFPLALAPGTEEPRVPKLKKLTVCYLMASRKHRPTPM
eukprot:TRINITY_DN25868_c0_g1_i2.p1 TRINITY_DN25868_c0_g1~~TRINITY_DN25868_c0_g1_i2.p1  ORF type:complete len:309 (+),score=55.93 TRINITY_DN25868_c0_g1_i2:129-1055(+)